MVRSQYFEGLSLLRILGRKASRHQLHSAVRIYNKIIIYILKKIGFVELLGTRGCGWHAAQQLVADDPCPSLSVSNQYKDFPQSMYVVQRIILGKQHKSQQKSQSCFKCMYLVLLKNCEVSVKNQQSTKYMHLL